MDNKNPAKDWITSPIPPIMFLTFTLGVAFFTGVAIIAITNSKSTSLLWASLVAILMLFFGFLLWLNTFQNLIKKNKPILITYRIEVELSETQRLGKNTILFNLDINPNKLYNVFVHLANGYGITHNSLKKFKLTQEEITSIQENFYKEGLIEMRGSTPQHGYDATPLGMKFFKYMAISPPPGADGGVIWQKT